MTPEQAAKNLPFCAALDKGELMMLIASLAAQREYGEEDGRRAGLEEAIRELRKHPGNCNHRGEKPFCCDVVIEKLRARIGQEQTK